RARARRGDRAADFAGRARVAVGHVRRALLVPRQDVTDRIAEHRVVRGQDRAARIAEDVGHALADQTLPENLRTGVVHDQAVTAPAAADETNFAYFAITPVVKRGRGGVHAASRAAKSAGARLTAMRRAARSIVITSPSRTAAIGPPLAASGAMCPTISPRVAPEKRPSVMSATDSPRPAPTIAPVTASISRMPGPPFGPS